MPARKDKGEKKTPYNLGWELKRLTDELYGMMDADPKHALQIAESIRKVAEVAVKALATNGLPLDPLTRKALEQMNPNLITLPHQQRLEDASKRKNGAKLVETGQNGGRAD